MATTKKWRCMRCRIVIEMNGAFHPDMKQSGPCPHNKPSGDYIWMAA